MNKKGFAISIVLYSLVFVLITIFYLLLGILKARYNVGNNLKDSIMKDLNSEYNVGIGDVLVRESIREKICSNGGPAWVDDMGTESEEDDITYLSGTNECVNFNYVWYSGKLWRITAIYPDGAMKLITANNITSMDYSSPATSSFATTNSSSHIYQWLNEDFYDTLYNPMVFIDGTKQWNDTVSTSESSRLPSTTMVTANVGLLDSYEYYNSYRCINNTNCTGTTYGTGYLNIGYSWWLLNPYNIENGLIWSVANLGINNYFNNYLGAGVRPSIVLKAGLEFMGSGTKEYPYRVIGDKNIGETNEYLYNRTSGEYVKLQNGNKEQVFRIVGVEDDKTKIIAMDYADNKNMRKFSVETSAEGGIIYGSGPSATVGENTWYNYLTGKYYSKLESTYGQIFDTGTYYMGECSGDSGYKLGICTDATTNTNDCTKTSDVGTFSIGLPRYGEMFATQQAGGYSNSISMCLITRRDISGDGNAWLVTNEGNSAGYRPTIATGARPTLHLKSTVKILSGKGTEKDPYVVGL